MAVTRERHRPTPHSRSGTGGDRQSGQGSVEYVGIVVAVGVLLVALVAVVPPIGDSLTCKLSQAIASIGEGSSDCAGGTPGAQGAETDENDDGRGDPAVATYPTRSRGNLHRRSLLPLRQGYHTVWTLVPTWSRRCSRPHVVEIRCSG